MYRYFFIAKNNMKKQKGDMITFFLMTFLSAFMIFICVNMLVGTFRLVDTNHKAINGADALILVTQDDLVTFKLKEIIQGNDKFEGYESNKYVSGLCKWRKEGEEWADYPFYIQSYDEERHIHTISIDTSSMSGNDIVLPVSLSTKFRIGDVFQLKVNENIYDFRVAGFDENYIFSSPMNMGSYLVSVSEKMYSQIEFESAETMNRGCLIKTDFSEKGIAEGADGDDIDGIYNEFNTWMIAYQETHPEHPFNLSLNIIPSQMMAIAGMILPFLFIAMVLVFALIILVVALVVIDFSVKNFIVDNMKNTGIMEAGGYTVKEMMLILLVQLMSVSFAGSFAGAALAAILQGKIGYIMIFLMGLPWNQKADIMVLAGVVLGICFIIMVFTLFLGRQYKKVTVLEALRGGINTHNYKKNLFPFERSALPISATMALKETFGKFRSQIGIIIIMAILSFSAAMGIGMFENMGKDVDALLTISGLDLYDADFEGDVNMADMVGSFECVDNIHYEVWLGLDFIKGKKTKSITTRVISDTTVMNPNQMVEGRWPLYENEVALGTSAANNLGVTVGDTIIVKNGEDQAQYIVTGLMQTFNNMGMMAYISKDGYERIGNMPNIVNCVIYLKDGYTFDDLEKEFKDIYPDTELVNELASTGGLFPLLKTSLLMVTVIIMGISAVIVALAESLLIRTRITKEWRNLGVYKALGFTSNQLITQIMVSNIPAISIGVILGLILVTLFGGNLVVLMFSIFGFKKVTFGFSIFDYVCVIILIIGVALLVSRLSGRKIKKLEPVKMITEE